MATAKSRSPRKSAAEHAPPIQPMPFPGESPTVSLALAAGRRYGLNDEDGKPARSRKPAKRRPQRKASASRPRKKAAPRAKAARTR